MISVIIPSYNRAGSILRSAQSVLEQTWRDLELIIVDDCSMDDTEAVVKGICDERVCYVRHEHNMGACAARNTGIQYAHGDYIAFQDSDDKWMPEKLEQQIQVIKETDADLVFCRYLRIEDGKEPTVGPVGYKTGFLKPVKNLYGIGTQTLLGKAAVFKNNLFDPSMPRFQDLELLVRLAGSYTIYSMEDVLVEYNRGTDTISTNPRKSYEACRLLLDKHPEIPRVYRELGRSLSGRLLKDAKSENCDSTLSKQMRHLALNFDTGFHGFAKMVAKTFEKE